MTGVPNPSRANDDQDARGKRKPQYSATFYAAMSGLALVLFVIKVCSHGSALGLISTGGLAVLMVCRAWSAKRHRNHQ